MNRPINERQQSFSSLSGASVDLLVVGGGIVGAGVARDAALRGLATLLVEQSNFASGTSSRSSRLLHGGLRYLAQGRIGLVREASLEKLRLSRFASHLCQPLPFLFPVWRGSGWSRWQLSLGVIVYDLLCGGRNLERSSTWSRDALLRHLPGLRSTGLTGATRHFDALTQDSRLVIDTLRSAVGAGARVRNYTSFVTGLAAGAGWECEIRDPLTEEALRVHTRAIVNAAGAWGARFPQSGLRLRLTKGVHLVVDRQRLAVDDAIILPEGDRILFVIPWGERIILGTTDTDYPGDPADVFSSPADEQYILDVVNRAFPSARLIHEDVISTWAGIRPLIAPLKLKSGAPSDTSRQHLIAMSQPGWFDIAGGKLTTYRLMAEQAVDQVGRFLGIRLPPSPTAKLHLKHGPYSGVLPPPIEPEVVDECCSNEWPVHLDDLLLRRTSWHYYHRNRDQIAVQAADWMAQRLGWNEEQTAAELSRYRELR